ncbi:hypothetical protein [Streptomyces cylindrosporus]|uniref:Lipoprotein n=1 Tax=Streptomyces cylindrosporus TaxID=2927583 RepID=A0ABS9Y478_9ACTN|nr:hypothetical protein [Streptomyces cylindrosporus]MCI3272027.1 hypothetical protein [Streptomyces cylindrosporus]
MLLARTLARALALLTGGVLLTACAGTSPSSPPARPSPDDLIKAATQLLTDGCLTRQGLTPPRPGQGPASEARQQRVADALFGAGPAELSLTLPTGYVVRAHTDGCLAAANQRLYGDQRRWFRASVIVDNLRAEAARAHLTLDRVRARHRAELADYRRLRAHAVREASALLNHTDQPSTESTRP